MSWLCGEKNSALGLDVGASQGTTGTLATLLHQLNATAMAHMRPSGLPQSPFLAWEALQLTAQRSQSRANAKQTAYGLAVRGAAPPWQPQGCASKGCRSTPLMITFASSSLRKARSQTPRSFAQGKLVVKDFTLRDSL